LRLCPGLLLRPDRDRIEIRLNGYNGAPAEIFTSDSILVRRLDIAKGAHTAAWDGKDAQGRRVEPGVYYVRFGDQVQKIILVE
jgi:flagellar hook assembly protein FlgD